MKRLIVSIAVALLLLVGLLPGSAVLADTSGSSSGSFSIQHEVPMINSVALYDSTGTTQLYSMTPQTQYQIKVDITDLNSLGNLTTFIVSVVYATGTPVWPGNTIYLTGDAAAGQKVVPVGNTASFTHGDVVVISDVLGHIGTYTVDTITLTSLTMTTNLTDLYTVANHAAIAGTGNINSMPNSQTCAQFIWIKSSGVWSVTAAFPPAPGDTGDTTWSLQGYTAPIDNSASNFLMTLNFTPGKVATAGVNKWYIVAGAIDMQNYSVITHSSALTMNPYDEIVLSTTNLNWGNVVPGLRFGDSPNPKSVTVKYIANGPYDKYVSSNNWGGSTYTATLDNTGGASGTNHFSLQAAIGAQSGYMSTVTGPNPYGTLINNTGILTYEAGDNFTGISGSYLSTMSLALNSVFNTDTYNGTIIYSITTR